MINIKEDISTKITGITSLYISFNYNPEIVKIMQGVKPSVYDKNTKIWETSITNLSYLLDTLVYLDDINLELYEDNSDTGIIHIRSEFKTKPFNYQLEGIEYGLNHGKWLLFDEPGLGKTLQILYLAEERYNRGEIDHCLIICGINALKPNWEREIKKHSKLSSRIIGFKQTKTGSIKNATIPERAEEILNPIEEFFVIINVEMIRENSIINAINNSQNKFDMIVLDEAHRCLTYDTYIKTDIGDIKIGDIVENNIECKVLSINKKGKLEFLDILNRFRFKANKIMELKIEDEKGRIHTLTCTEDHKIYTSNRGYVEASKLNDNDVLEILD